MLRELLAAGYGAGLALFLLAIVAAAALRLYPNRFDRPVARAINSFATAHDAINEAAVAAVHPAVEAAIVVSLVWFCWFSNTRPEPRAGLAIGAAAAVLAGLAACGLRYLLPPTVKPIFDPLLRLRVPAALGEIDAIRAHSFPNSPSFPSERATMFAGLSLAIFCVRTDIGIAAIACAAAVELSRVYLGYHYPTDFIGSFSLAGAFVCLAQFRYGQQFGLWLIGWERSSPATFYICAIVASYQVVTAFQGLRLLLRSAVRS